MWLFKDRGHKDGHVPLACRAESGARHYTVPVGNTWCIVVLKAGWATIWMLSCCRKCQAHLLHNNGGRVQQQYHVISYRITSYRIISHCCCEYCVLYHTPEEEVRVLQPPGATAVVLLC